MFRCRDSMRFLGWTLACATLAACAPRPGAAPPKSVEATALDDQPNAAPPTETAPRAAPEMIEIPAGEFVRGSAGGPPDEQPVRVIRLSAFLIDRTEVDVGAYALCVAADACTPAGRGPGCNAARLDRVRHPVNCVSWTQADAYCKYAKKRLPSEAEWEKAARSGDARPYAWGLEWPPRPGAGNFADRSAAEVRPYWSAIADYQDGFADTAPVDTRAIATLQGGLHFAGNVSEWVADFYDPKAYAAAAETDPTGPMRGKTRVVRGGSFGNARREDLTATRRAFYDPAENSQHFGVRCVKSAG